MSGEPPAPGTAADRAGHPLKPPKSTGDARLDRKRALTKSERERRAAETLASKKAASRARREASAAAASVDFAELTFFKDTVRRMAEKYNALKSANDARASQLAALVTDFAERDAKRGAQVNDALALRGGGGALFGKPASRRAGGANPRSDLTLEELRVRVTDVERNAEDEVMRTATLGRMILRLRETAVAGAGAAESTVPRVAREVELVKRFQPNANGGAGGGARAIVRRGDRGAAGAADAGARVRVCAGAARGARGAARAAADDAGRVARLWQSHG